MATDTTREAIDHLADDLETWGLGRANRAARMLRALAAENAALREEADHLRIARDEAEAEADRVWNEAIDEAAALVDCGCSDARKAAVRAAWDRENSAERWRACGEAHCGALDAVSIRALRREGQGYG